MEQKREWAGSFSAIVPVLGSLEAAVEEDGFHTILE